MKVLFKDLFVERFRPPLFLKVPIGPRPPFENLLEPEPEVSNSGLFEQQTALNSELLSIALRQSTTTPAMKELRDSGLVLEAANEVLIELRAAVNALEEEIEEEIEERKQCQCK